MKNYEKIIILILFIVLSAAGFIVGFWLGGGFDSTGIADYQEREQAFNRRFAELEQIESGLRAELESERAERESIDRVIESERQENKKLRSIITDFEKYEISASGRLSENDKRLESVIEKAQRIRDNIDDSNSNNSY